MYPSGWWGAAYHAVASQDDVDTILAEGPLDLACIPGVLTTQWDPNVRRARALSMANAPRSYS